MCSRPLGYSTYGTLDMFWQISTMLCFVKSMVEGASLFSTALLLRAGNAFI